MLPDIFIAPDSFKGCLGPDRVADAIRDGLLRAGYNAGRIRCYPLSDGGDGFLSTVSRYVDSSLKSVKVHGPMGELVDAAFLSDMEGNAYIESASACGLSLVPEEKRDPLALSSFGVGELILAAMEGGAKRIVVGLGGSATCEGGVGMLQALGAKFVLGDGSILKDGEPALTKPVASMEISPIIETLRSEVRLEIWVDTKATMCSERDCITVFGPQKGLKPESMGAAKEWMKTLSGIYKTPRSGAIEGGGAAGGLGAALSCVLGGEILSGAEELIRLSGILEDMKRTGRGCLITGEGRLDATTWSGKLVSRLVESCTALENIKTVAVCAIADSEATGRVDAVIEVSRDLQGGGAMDPTSTGERISRMTRAFFARRGFIPGDPEISVIVPVYGVEKYIERCARSLFGQSFRNVEFIFVDDKTPDRSIEILESVLEQYPERRASTTIIRLERNSGLPEARRRGFLSAGAEYIVQCDSDDWMERDMLSKMYAAARREDADIVCCAYRMSSGEDDTDAPVRREKRRRILQGPVWNKMARRRLYADIDFPLENMSEDSVLMTQLSFLAGKVVYTDEALYNYFPNPASMCRDITKEKCLENFRQSLENDRVKISFMERHGAADRFSSDIIYWKYNTRKLLNPYIGEKDVHALWKNTYPEINGKVFFCKAVPPKSRFEYLFIRLGWTRGVKMLDSIENFLRRICSR